MFDCVVIADRIIIQVYFQIINLNFFSNCKPSLVRTWIDAALSGTPAIFDKATADVDFLQVT